MKLAKVNRRKFVQTSSLVSLFGVGFNPTIANAFVTNSLKAARHFRFPLGDITITVVSDGMFSRPIEDEAINVNSNKEMTEFLKSYHLSFSKIYRHTNHVVIEKGESKILVDVGSGNRFVPTVGKLHENLHLAGIDPETITHVVLTHAHPDHVWGIRDDFDEVVFPNAKYFMGETEYGWWMQENLVDTVEKDMQQLVLGAQNSLSALEEITLVGGNYEVDLSIKMIDLPGHTPGHMGVRVESGGLALIICGDALKHPYFDFKKPHWFGAQDMNGFETVKTRKMLLDECAVSGSLVLGYHFPFPGVGQVAKIGNSYEFVPLVWDWE
jgi:glyoxylase-like metal-dependent hydrolase (beta-lactamase superfamily II)